jgi:tRNA 2-thiouridine synthesizing protein B
MSTLHLVNRPWPATDALARCIAHCRAGDNIVLIEDGVLGAVAETWAQLAPAGNTVTLYAIIDDVTARGISDYLAPACNVIDYDAFVALAVAHTPVVTWF